ncbi:ECF transporter S component [Microbacterium sp. NPDC076895]|jgi:energy-coupling factor transport system substrate-specific component|uniref:ECF transporter S component n=1 Tax=Microbacterium sp. NPDC076895 TaxID=3154957 RepID=UPI003421B11A
MHIDEHAEHGRVMDRLVAELQLLRLSAGDVSYTQIADRVRELRHSRGETGSAAFVGRTTIYDAFQPGRHRINPDLVADIASVLGEDTEGAARWREYCIRARADEHRRRRDATSEPARAGSKDGAPAGSATGRGTTTLAHTPTKLPQGSSDSQENWLTRRLGERGATLTVLTLIVIACALVNVSGSRLAVTFALPLYLDMIGTAIAAIALGPWFGVGVAILSHSLGALVLWEWQGLTFMIVNIVGALIWGYGVRAWRMGMTPLRYFLLNMMVAISCTIVATPIIMLVWGGVSINEGAQGIAANLVTLGQSVIGAVFSANILTSMMDKLIAGFIAISVLPYAIAALPPSARGIQFVPSTMHLRFPKVFTPLPDSVVTYR